MRSPMIVAAFVAMACSAASPAAADPGDAWTDPLPACSIEVSQHSPWSVSFGAMPPAAGVLRLPHSAARTQAAPPRRPVPVEYSDGYKTRARIHKISSFATLPLFVAQYAVGQKLYNGNGSDSTRSLHNALAASTAVLFGVNTVTGVWNLGEGRKDPKGRTKRMIHGLLMAAADTGFVATGMLAPETDEGEGEGGGNRSTHRTVALASMGVATVAYLMMLIH